MADTGAFSKMGETTRYIGRLKQNKVILEDFLQERLTELVFPGNPIEEPEQAHLTKYFIQEGKKRNNTILNK